MSEESKDKKDEELTEESLQKELAAYQQAIKQEFETNSSKAKDDVRAMEDVTMDYFRKNSAMAAAQIVHLSQYSSSDSTRLNAAKYIIERGFKEEIETGDPIKRLLEELSGNDKKKKNKDAANK